MNLVVDTLTCNAQEALHLAVQGAVVSIGQEPKVAGWVALPWEILQSNRRRWWKDAQR